MHMRRSTSYSSYLCLHRIKRQRCISEKEVVPNNITRNHVVPVCWMSAAHENRGGGDVQKIILVQPDMVFLFLRTGWTWTYMPFFFFFLLHRFFLNIDIWIYILKKYIYMLHWTSLFFGLIIIKQFFLNCRRWGKRKVNICISLLDIFIFFFKLNVRVSSHLTSRT